jgi:putative ABC transport system permease protein
MALITAIMRGIALAALAMGGFGLMNILLLGVTERTMELGVRLAVGARQVDLLVQFLVEAVTLALVGGMLGVGIGLGAAPFMPLILGGRASYPAPPSLSALAAALGLTVAIGLVFGTYPALRASRLDPVAALRSE